MVTSHDVARAAGVSQATVSRALSGGNVSDATRRRVLAAIESTGYVPNGAARAMRVGRTRAVGIVVADLLNPFYPQMLAALSSVFDRADYRVVVWLASRDGNNAALQAIQERAIDGVVFTTATADSPELRHALDHGSPIVLVNRPLAGIECDQVASDNRRGGRLVARYLRSHGRRRIGYIGGSPTASTSEERHRGFAEELDRLGYALPAELVCHGEYTHAEGVAAARRMLGRPAPPDAIFCANDLLAFGAIDGARELGVRVPEDLWIVGYDDIPMAAWSAYSLTTVRQNIDDEAAIAARLLIDRIEGRRGEPLSRTLPPELVVRHSTAGSAWIADEHCGDPPGGRLPGTATLPG